MPRSVSQPTKQAIYDQETDEAFLVLLTLSHEDLASPIRVVNNGVDIVSNGDTFQGFPFDINLPSELEAEAPSAKITIDNVDQQMIVAIQSISSAPAIKLELVRSGDTDTIEAVFDNFKLTSIEYNAESISGTLTIEDFVLEPYPNALFSPANFPGLF